MYIVACAVLLLPSPLLEPRYFILPLIIGGLNAPPLSLDMGNVGVVGDIGGVGGVRGTGGIGGGKSSTSRRVLADRVSVVLQLLGSIVVYIGTVYMFLYRPWIGPEGVLSRFMF